MDVRRRYSRAFVNRKVRLYRTGVWLSLTLIVIASLGFGGLIDAFFFTDSDALFSNTALDDTLAFALGVCSIAVLAGIPICGIMMYKRLRWASYRRWMNGY